MTSDAQAGPRAGVPPYVVMDTQDPYKIAPFWCALLGVEVSSDRDAGYVVSLAPSPALDGMVLALQRVPEAKVGTNRMHFDVFRRSRIRDRTRRRTRRSALGRTQQRNCERWRFGLADHGGPGRQRVLPCPHILERVAPRTR